jgi:hypothetical protein
MSVTDKDLDKLSLPELANLLTYYNVYDTTTSKDKPRPSGGHLKKYLQHRLRTTPIAGPALKPELPHHIILDLNALGRFEGGVSLLNSIERELEPFLHRGNKALRRKPMEIAREVVLALMERDLYISGRFQYELLLLLHEGPYGVKEGMCVQVRGVDWMVYYNQHVAY